MFTPIERTALRAEIVARARRDSRISGIAITGSAANDAEDRWSDIDLAMGVEDPSTLHEVLTGFSQWLFEEHHAIHSLDIQAGPWTYRVFLMPGTLQVDLAFVGAEDFRALSPSFRLVHGQAREPAESAVPNAETLVGMGWLYALHARTSIARAKPWQAVHMINGIRDHALALACLRHNVSTFHGRGFDELPAEVTEPFEETLVGNLTPGELTRAFHSAVRCLLREIEATDKTLGARLATPLGALL